MGKRDSSKEEVVSGKKGGMVWNSAEEGRDTCNAVNHDILCSTE